MWRGRESGGGDCCGTVVEGVLLLLVVVVVVRLVLLEVMAEVPTVVVLPLPSFTYIPDIKV